LGVVIGEVKFLHAFLLPLCGLDIVLPSSLDTMTDRAALFDCGFDLVWIGVAGIA